RRPPDMHRRFLCEDGAVSEQTAGHEPLFIDPPADEEKRLELQKLFQLSWARRAKAAFATLRLVATGHTNLGFQHGGALTFKWPEDWAGPQPAGTFQGVADAVPALLKLKEHHD